MTKPVVCFFLVFCIRVSGAADDVSRWEKQASEVTIIRDNYGIPHIYGKTDALAVCGLMYAQCEDDFNRVETNYITAMGCMAEAKGEREIFADLRMKLFVDPEKLKQEYTQSPPWLKALMDAFADGINYYLYRNPGVRPGLLTHFEPWMALAFTEGSIGGDIEQIPVSSLEKFYGGRLVFGQDNSDQMQDRGGSNGFAIAPANTVARHAMLLINPHTSLFFRSEVHMNSEQGLNAYGAVTWGQFFIYQGFNETCGWMHTSSGADAIDYYLETVVEKFGKFYYQYGNELRPFNEKKIRLNYIQNGIMKGREITVFYSHHGPVIGEKDGKWITVRLMVKHERALIQSYLRTKAAGYKDFNRIMRLRTNSSNNTVYADRDGNIAYYHGNFIPVRDRKYDWSEPVDGSVPGTEWKGLHSLKEMITIRNPSNGWIQNCNSTPFRACGDNSSIKDDYPVYMAPEPENARSLHAISVLQGKKDFTFEKLIAAAYDPYLTGFAELIPSLVAAFDNLSLQEERAREDLSGPVDLLRNWDLRYGVNSVPTTLAVYYGQELNSRNSRNEKPAGLSGDPEVLQVDALASAVMKLEHDFGTWKVPWGEINRYQRVTGALVQQFNDGMPSLPVPFVSGRWGSLAAFESRTYPGTRMMYGTRGNSFVAVVEFGEKVRAKSILAGGISGDPASPHFSDQSQMYVEGKFKDVLFYREDVENNTALRYHPGFD